MSHDSKKSSKEIKVKTGLKSKTINVDYLARVEGEGAMTINLKGNDVESVFKNFVFLVGRYASGRSERRSQFLFDKFSMYTVNSNFNELWTEVGKKIANNESTKAKVASFIRTGA